MTREPAVTFPTFCVFCIRIHKLVILKTEAEFTEHLYDFHKGEMLKFVRDIHTKMTLDRTLEMLSEEKRKERNKDVEL